MTRKTEQLTEQQMKTINGGDGIVAYDPVTGEPFPEENGGNPSSDRNEDQYYNPAFDSGGKLPKDGSSRSF